MNWLAEVGMTMYGFYWVLFMGMMGFALVGAVIGYLYEAYLSWKAKPLLHERE